ncbi:hypothetical protein H8958_005194 [Nasalis larvatus]
MVHTQVQGTPWQSVGHPLPGKDTSCIKETRVSGVRRLKAGPRGEPSHGRRCVHVWRNLKVWVQSLRSCTGSTWGRSRWTGSSRVCSNWTGSRMTHSLRSSSRAYSNCTGSNHKSHSPPWSPHRSHSWGRNRLAQSSTWACSSKRAHSSRSQSPHSWSHSLQSSHSSPWFRQGSILAGLDQCCRFLMFDAVRHPPSPQSSAAVYLIPAGAPRDVVSSLWQLWLRMAGFSALGKEYILCLPPPCFWTSLCGQGNGLCDYRREVHTARSLGTCEKSFPLLWNYCVDRFFSWRKTKLGAELEEWGRDHDGYKQQPRDRKDTPARRQGTSDGEEAAGAGTRQYGPYSDVAQMCEEWMCRLTTFQCASANMG